jgi:hypothetical protein
MSPGAARSLEQEAAEDVFFGQVVMIWAHWFLIASGAVFFLWTAKERHSSRSACCRSSG